MSIHYWDEEELEPVTEEVMMDGLRAAMEEFAHLLPKEDTCPCFTCRAFRAFTQKG